MKKLQLLQLSLIALALVHASYYYPSLPARVASHFNAAGYPDGWMQKKAFLSVYLGTVALTALTCVLLSVFMKHVPESLINLPGKDYWFAPERIDSAKEEISRRLLVMGIATTLFLIGIMHLVFAANLEPVKNLPMTPFWLLLGGFCCFSLWWAASFIIRFSKKPDQSRRG